LNRRLPKQPAADTVVVAASHYSDEWIAVVVVVVVVLGNIGVGWRNLWGKRVVGEY
jgi:hypothetical protein